MQFNKIANPKIRLARSESIHAFGMTKIVWPSSSTTLCIPTTFGSIVALDVVCL
jgi:hypothetical protein